MDSTKPTTSMGPHTTEQHKTGYEFSVWVHCVWVNALQYGRGHYPDSHAVNVSCSTDL